MPMTASCTGTIASIIAYMSRKTKEDARTSLLWDTLHGAERNGFNCISCNPLLYADCPKRLCRRRAGFFLFSATVRKKRIVHLRTKHANPQVNHLQINAIQRYFYWLWQIAGKLIQRIFSVYLRIYTQSGIIDSQALCPWRMLWGQAEVPLFAYPRRGATRRGLFIYSTYFARNPSS